MPMEGKVGERVFESSSVLRQGRGSLPCREEGDWTESSRRWWDPPGFRKLYQRTWGRRDGGGRCLAASAEKPQHCCHLFPCTCVFPVGRGWG
jgi:hypothetical protein